MRALFFLNSFTGGGAETVCLNLAKQLYDLKIESDFITIYNIKEEYDLPDYIHVFCLEIEDKPLACCKMIWWINRVNAFISGKKYVLITAHLQPSQLLASLTLVGKKCFYVMHGSQHLRDKNNSWIYRIVLRLFLRGKKVITVSRGLRKELITEYSIRPGNITTIYNPCVVEGIKSEIALCLPHTRPYILALGRIEEPKNPLLILELYHKGGFYHDYDLIYVGKGTLMGELRRMIEEYNLQEHVFLVGFQKNPMQWLRSASLLLSCSKREGLPMNMIEALTCGVPVVAADCPYGPNEILTGELSAYLIDPENDAGKSIEVISSALRSYPEIQEKHTAKFDRRVIAEIYLKTWKECFD